MQIKKPNYSFTPGFRCSSGEFELTALLWVDEKEQPYFWDITVVDENSNYFIHCELYTRANFTMRKMKMILKAIKGKRITTIKRYLKFLYPVSKCNVYQYDEVGLIISRTKGAGEPMLKFPGTRDDIDIWATKNICWID